MKAILEKFPKAILIEFIRSAVSPFRYDGTNDLEGQLLYIQWETETKVHLDEMDAASAAMVAASEQETIKGRILWYAAQKRWQKANRLLDKAEKLLEKSNQLRGR